MTLPIGWSEENAERNLACAVAEVAAAETNFLTEKEKADLIIKVAEYRRERARNVLDAWQRLLQKDDAGVPEPGTCREIPRSEPAAHSPAGRAETPDSTPQFSPEKTAAIQRYRDELLSHTT